VRYKVRPRTLDEGRIPVSRTIIRHAMGRGEGVLSTNAMNDTRFQSGDSVRDYGIRSAICTPIVAGSRRLGVINIDSQLADFTFTEQQLRLLNAIGQHTGLSLLTTEATEARMASERLAAIGETVASLSHSIKNIMQGLRGGADAVELALNKGDVAMAREGWPILARNLDRILTLTSNMLAYARRRQPELELTDLHALVREVASLLSPQCDRKRAALMLDLDESMPPLPIDAGGIHQALTNVVGNAIDAVPARRGAITVRTAFSPERHEATIVVLDNGPGIPETQRERIFEAFTSTKGQRGTGLGLAVTRKIVEEHGGRIGLACDAGGGTTMTIVLPSDRGDLDASDTKLPKPLEGDRLDFPG
jgi:signal transduction histidine kinase